MVIQYCEDSSTCRYVVMFDADGEEAYHKGMDIRSEAVEHFGAREVKTVFSGEKFWVPPEVMLMVSSRVDGMEIVSWRNKGTDGFTVTMRNMTDESLLIKRNHIFCRVNFKLICNPFHSQQTWVNIYCYARMDDVFEYRNGLDKCHLNQ